MRIFALILAFMSFSLWAQDFETQLNSLRSKREEALFRFRTVNRFNETELTPHSKAKAYQEFITKLEEEHLAAELRLIDETCQKTKQHCITESEKSKREAELKTKLDDIAQRVAPLAAGTSQRRADEVPVVSQRPVTPEVRPEVRPETQVVTPSQNPGTVPIVKPDVAITAPQTRTQTEVPETKPEVVERPEVEEKPEEVTTPEEEPQVVETPPEVRPEVRPETRPETPTVPRENEDEKSPRNYNAETCKWVSDMPRRIVVGPGCGGKSKSRMCVGYVVCEQKNGGGKFVRQSTCGADKCGEGDAVKCTKDQYYFSTKPADETQQFVSPRLKQIMSSEQ